MAIIKQYYKRSGITYVYDFKSFYDKEKKCSRAKRTLILSSLTIRILTNQYSSILDIAAKEYEEHPPSSYFMDGYNLFKRLRDYKQDHLFFLSHPEIDCTNNISKRQLRKFKRKQKQAVVLRSDLGWQYICDALTIIETAKMQHQNVYDIAIAAFRK